MELSGNQRRFINWLLDPRPPLRNKDGTDSYKGTQAQFAEQIGVTPQTLTKWKKDPGFRAAWEKAHADATGGIARYSELMEQLRKIAMMEIGGTRPADARSAIMNYLELSGRFQPKKTLEIKDPALVDMDDEELAAIARRRFKVIEGAKALDKPPRRAAKRSSKTS